MAIGLERLRARTRSVAHEVAALVIAGLSLLGIVFGLIGQPVGGALDRAVRGAAPDLAKARCVVK